MIENKIKRQDIPIVLFTFVRLETVQLIFEQIRKVQPKVIYVFSDGAREQAGEAEKVNQVRNYLGQAIDWPCEKKLYFYAENKGCDRNIREGLDLVFAEQSKAIVFEDDAVPLLEFFDYCSELLDLYEQDVRIQYIAGFNAIGDSNIIKEDYTFAKTTPMSGAFATWANRWNQCDFAMTKWPQNRTSKEFLSTFQFAECRKSCMKELDNVYNRVVTAWDFMFEHDMLDKGRVAIVPKGNLATSYGYMEGAFHPQAKKEAKRLFPLMEASKNPIYSPYQHPKCVEHNKEYDRVRQMKMLQVRGNYLERHIKQLCLDMKGWFYLHVPRNVWKVGKRIFEKL